MPYYSSAGHGSPMYGCKGEAGAGPPTAAGGAPESSYAMEHLATFTVTKDTGIVYPADGMRRLLQLEKSNGIWSQKMQMRLERSWVLIMDNETGAVMERFPAGLIQEPTAFTSRDPMEMYNNILVFTVADEAGGQRAEMHIFQCQSVSAQDLVEDLKMLQAGKLGGAGEARGARAPIPPPPALPPPEPPLNGLGREPGAGKPLEGAAAEAPSAAPPEEAARDDNQDEVSSTSSDKYERDVSVLNHCFDDIEKFIARLQHAAAASRELERRRRQRKSKKRNLGDGMLTMRAKPPPELEFVDIFQKFKLSFNLLAKLKAHIHDPNAPELVHFLFTPLALIVDASHDTSYEANLPARVAAPLLSREAVNLLMNCVTSKETELWHSLGDAWLVPREQWKGHVPTYHPVFMDGWSPDFPPLGPDERDAPAHAHDHLASLLSADRRKRDDPSPPDHHRHHHHQPAQHAAESYYAHRELDESHYSSDYLDYEGREERAGQEYLERGYERGAPELYGGREPEGRERERAHSDISLDSIERGPRAGGAQEAWLDELAARRAKVVQVTYPRTANNDKELTVVRGEFLEVLDDSRKWWKARNCRGQVAHVPHTIVTAHSPGPAASPDSELFYATRYQRQVYGYEDSEIDAANASPGSEAPHRAHAIPPPAPADWVRKERLGKKGDSSKINLNSDTTSLTSSESTYAETRVPRNLKLQNVLPPLSPLLPVEMPNPKMLNKAVSVDSTRTIEQVESQDQRGQIHEELKHVLTKRREKKQIRNDDKICPKTEEKKLSYEIQAWNDQRFSQQSK
ncbi:epidermal growth factor receptor kinase substrate 8-like protein 2 [Phymastichus coffea]|uniref:epidermal growth factor receptor kinase substrate 8-like protein 2 n=1 Tax=Phymastichus coffea TaxID=108790 RepID=UPI00273B8199|nr:epidermal growth factor receptor kinase substrate 8-like protein 2 [Phymastichus coffea]